MQFVLSSVAGWINQRREIRHRWQGDARALLSRDERGAYYAAQRLAARARARGNRREFVHWTKVAAEVARLSPIAEIDLAVVKVIANEELTRGEEPGAKL